MFFYSMEKITSKANDRIKYAVKIRENASFRKQENLFFAEGARLCFDAASSGVEIAEFFVTNKALERYEEYVCLVEKSAERCFVVSEEVAGKLSDTKGNQGVFCLCKMLDKNIVLM